jgi:hypothetical protein
MKKLILIFIIFILTFCLILWTKGKAMREIRTEIEIAAPPAKVWSILTDFNKWSEWSPIINQASGTASLGSKLNITRCGKDGKNGKVGPNYEPVITVFEEPKHFQWQATMMAGFIFTNGKVLELEETFSGIMVPMMWGQMESSVPQMLNSMNEALKRVAERL